MLYHYLASDKAGKVIEGDVDAQNLGGVLQFLAGKDLRPVAVKAMKQGGSVVRGLFGGISTADKVFITKYLALMLRVGTDLLSAINILIADFDKPAVKNLLLEVRDNLSQGKQFYETFAHYPTVFSPVFVSLIKAAEASGNLQRTFEELSDSLQREVELNNRVTSAFIYPAILMAAASAISVFLVMFAIPRIANVFAESGIQPPIFSQIVFAIGLFANKYIFPIIFITLTALGGSYYFLWLTTIGRRIRDSILSHLPFIKSVYREFAIQRFAATFSSLMKAGLPIIQTCRITADVVGSEDFRLALLRVADEGLTKGLGMGDAFRRETVFPRVVTNLVAISERAGHLEEVLATLADFYATNIDSKIRSLVAILEPLLLMAMGLVVGAIALAIILPIYQLTSQF